MKHTIETLKRELARVRNSRDFWKRQARSPGYEAARKARWRRENPGKASLQQFKDSIQAKLRKLP